MPPRSNKVPRWRRRTICRQSRSPVRLFPALQLVDWDTAVPLALEKMGAPDVEAAWSDALSSSQCDKMSVTLISSEGMILERRQQRGAGSMEEEQWDHSDGRFSAICCSTRPKNRFTSS
jgi:hypothetical protein